MDFNLFWIHFGDSLTLIPLIVTPQYLGAKLVSLTWTSILWVLFSTLKLLFEGVINSNKSSFLTKPAFKSRATPKWLMASALLGVNPISKTWSFSISKISEPSVPATIFLSRIIMPSWLFPSPNSSSAHIIPWLSSPRILPFFIFEGFPSSSYSTVPIVATGTFCPLATFGAPQTICTTSPFPMSTLVTFKRSAFGCWSHSKTCPTTIPFNPPITDSKASIPSISSPKSVNKFPVFLASQSTLINCFNQLYEIFMLKICYNLQI